MTPSPFHTGDTPDVSLRIPSEPIAVTRLANGVRVVSRALPAARSVALGIWLAHGSRHEAAHENGYTHLWEHLWFRARNGECANEIDRLGAYVNAYTTRELCALHGRVLPQHLPSLLRLFVDMITAPDFAAHDVARERDVVLAEMAAGGDSPDTVIEDAAALFAWGDHPLARSALGTRSTLETVRAADIRALSRRALAGRRMCVVATGAIAHADLLSHAAELARLPPGIPEILSRPIFHSGRYAKRAGVARSRLLWLMPIAAASEVDQPAALLAHRVLAGGLDSRLSRALRGERALAYEFHSRLERYSDAGLWVIRASCAPEPERECQRAIEECLRQLGADGVTHEELAAARRSLRTEFILDDEDLEASAERLARETIYRARTLTLEQRQQEIDSVGVRAVAKAAAEAARRVLRLTWSP